MGFEMFEIIDLNTMQKRLVIAITMLNADLCLPVECQ